MIKDFGAALRQQVLLPLASSGMLRTIDLIQYAEDEISTAKDNFPDHADDIDKAFMLCCPRKVQFESEKLYRLHVREMLSRIVNGGTQLYAATDAEVLAVCARLGDDAPLRPGAFALYAILFIKLFEADVEIVCDRDFLDDAETMKKMYEVEMAELDNSVRAAVAGTQSMKD